MGRLNAATTDICHLQVAQVFCLSKLRRLSCGILVADITSVFASIARRIAILDLPESEECWRRHLHLCGLSMEEATDIVFVALSILCRRTS